MSKEWQFPGIAPVTNEDLENLTALVNITREFVADLQELDAPKDLAVGRMPELIDHLDNTLIDLMTISTNLDLENKLLASDVEALDDMVDKLQNKIDALGSVPLPADMHRLTQLLSTHFNLTTANGVVNMSFPLGQGVLERLILDMLDTWYSLKIT